MVRVHRSYVKRQALVFVGYEVFSKQVIASCEVFNIVDDSLVKDVIKAGELTESVSHRVAQYIQLAEQGGADQILVTCSSIGAAVETAADTAHVPVL